MPEPENKADPAAVAVMVGINGGRGLYRLGYVPRNMTAVISIINRQLPALRVVSGTRGMYNNTTYGARISLTV